MKKVGLFIIISFMIVLTACSKTVACTSCGLTKQCKAYKVNTIWGTTETWWLCDSCHELLEAWTDAWSKVNNNQNKDSNGSNQNSKDSIPDTETPESNDDKLSSDESALGQVYLLEDLNIRSGPGTNYSSSVVMKKGNTARYYEVKNAGGYTWYRISDNSWIADDGTWLEIDGATPVSSQAIVDKTIIQERALQKVKNYAKITESRVDSSFAWYIYEAADNVYQVSYAGDVFGGVIVIKAEVIYDPKTDTMECNIYQDNRNAYDPDKNYSVETMAHYEEPYVEPEYTEEEVAIIKAVEEHCTWWDKFLSQYPKESRTKGSYYCWNVYKSGTISWHAELGQFSLTSASYVYECDVIWDGSRYVITDTVDWISDSL